MRLKTNKTPSRQQLAIKLPVGQRPDLGLFSVERKRLIILAAKTALVAALCWGLAQIFGWRDAYWGSISAIIVLQSNVGSTITASRDRILGTLIGSAFGFSFSLFGVLPWNYIVAVFAAMALCGLLGLRNSSRLAGVSITIVMLVQKPGPRWELALDRVGQVILGIVVALAVSTLVFPDRARIRLRDGLAQEFLLLGAFFEALLKAFRGSPSGTLPSLREEARAVQRGNAQLLDATRNELFGGREWSDGLDELSEFGCSLFDVLIAFELSVEGSHEDAYAQQLEPALGKLVADIRGGFHHVAECIHKWSFDVEPPIMNLEEDIEQLATRMDQLRHTGIDFAQSEILRAYAVQLHLKQIARRLRASRVETRRAIGETQK